MMMMMMMMIMKMMMTMKMTKMILIDDGDVNANNKYAFIFIKYVPKQWWEGMVGKKRIYIDLQHHIWRLSCLKPKAEG